jgi:tetratricopeptide (TPR) repeat protein
MAASLDTVLSRVAEADDNLKRERDEAPLLLQELRQHPPARQQTLVRNSRRFSTWGFGELLMARSRDTVFDDPQTAVHLAGLARDVGNGLNASLYGSALVADYRGKACMTLGNARRVVSDLSGAEESFAEAEETLMQGTGDPFEIAQLDYHRGALRSAQRRFPEAHRHFDRAIKAYRKFGEPHLEARALVAKAATHARAGDVEESIRLQRVAMPLIDGVREPRVVLAAQHNLAMDLVDSGRPAEALDLLDSCRPLYAQLGQRMLLVRLRWVEANAAQALGDFDRAEKAYLEVRAEFQGRDIPYDAAVASLELATLYAEQGRTTEIKQLALEMLPVFQALEIQRETIAALILFRQAAEAETASLALLQHIAGFLKRAQHDPAARFSPPS